MKTFTLIIASSLMVFVTFSSLQADPADQKTTRLAKPAQLQMKPIKAEKAGVKRNKVYDHQRLSAGDGGTRYKCTYPGDGTYDCECKGMLDCSRLLNSGKCKNQPIWEDGNDPSIGGCDAVPEG